MTAVVIGGVSLLGRGDKNERNELATAIQDLIKEGAIKSVPLPDTLTRN